MEENQNNNAKSDQGKQSTAETNMTYNRDDTSLRNSATTSTADTDNDNTTHEGITRVDDTFDGNLDNIEIDRE